MSECQRYFYLEYFKFESLSAILILQTKVYISTSTNVDRMLEEATSWPFYRYLEHSPFTGFPQLVCVETQQGEGAILPETELKLRN